MSIRSRRQVRRLSLDTPWVRQPPVHNEIAVEKRRAKMWRRWRRILRGRHPAVWQTPDLSEYMAVIDEQTRVMAAETQTPLSLVGRRGHDATYTVFDETHPFDPLEVISEYADAISFHARLHMGADNPADGRLIVTLGERIPTEPTVSIDFDVDPQRYRMWSGTNEGEPVTFLSLDEASA